MIARAMALLDRHWTAIGLALVGLAVVVNVASLTTYPAPFCDEAGDASIGYTRVTDGYPRLDFLEPGRPAVPVNPGMGQLYYPVLGWMQVLTGRAFWAARLHSWLGWLVATGLVYLAGRAFRGPQVGLLAALVFAIDLAVWAVSHVARPEIWVMAYIAGTLYVYFRVREQPSAWGYLLLGFVAVQAPLQTYLSGVYFVAGFATLMLVESVVGDDRWRRFVFVGLGAAAGLALWGAVFGLPNREALVEILTQATTRHCDTAFCGPEVATPLVTTVVERVRSFAAWLAPAYLAPSARATLVMAVYVAVGAGYAAVRRRDGDWQLLVLWLAGLVALVVVPYRSYFYLATFAPMSALLIGSALLGLGDLARARYGSVAKAGSAALVAGLLLLPVVEANLLMQARLAVDLRTRDFDGYAAQVQALVPAETTVLGDVTLWFGLQGRNRFFADVILSPESFTVAGQGEDVTVGDVLAPYGIEYAVDDGTLGCEYLVTPRSVEYSAWLAETCSVVGTIEDAWFGVPADGDGLRVTTVYQCGDE